ncbi:MAG TPA: MFS transporter [Baekduia sp.]|uniref:MFS transporter n=1 Tax=Baekduia sp. TaxID=2600305 RepID=UPI002C997E5F|nr:MFS transporter [Baekduia sp.]HMJ35679.1 MFS transporter [Baekduia sp.]
MLGPLRERDFALLWGGMFVSLLGDGIYLVALPFAVLDLSGSATTLSLVGLAWSIGMVGFLLAGGLLADRYDKRRQLLIADLVRLLAVGAVGVLSLSGALEIWQLIVLSFVFGAGEGLSGPALGSIIPELVPESILVQANSLAQSLRPVGLRLAGPALGGLAVALLDTGGALLVDAGTFAISIVCLLAMRARPPVHDEEHEPLLVQMREAAGFVRSQTWLWATLVMAALALLLFLGPTEVLLPYRLQQDLEATAGSFGLVLSVGGAGALVGTVAIGHFGIPRREVTFLYWVWGVATFALCGYALADHVWQMVACSFLFGILSGAGNPVWATLMQVRVPPALRGRVSSLDWLVSVGLTPVSFALTGPAAAAFGAGTVLLVAGALGGVAIIALLYVIPGLRAEDGGVARATEAAADAAGPAAPGGPQRPSSDPRSSVNVG